MNPTITAFAASPDGGKGLARDMPVRWALEEVGQSYEVRLVSFEEMKQRVHLALHPFGQIPTYEEGELMLFETGAIVLHIAERHGKLLPDAAQARSRSIAWMFAALSTVEPPIVEREQAGYVEADNSWHRKRLPIMDARIHSRMEKLAAWLGDEEWLDGEFSAGDLMMIAVLRRLAGTNILADHPKLSAYVARGEARPAFRRAFRAQLAVFEEASGRSD